MYVTIKEAWLFPKKDIDWFDYIVDERGDESAKWGVRELQGEELPVTSSIKST